MLKNKTMNNNFKIYYNKDRSTFFIYSKEFNTMEDFFIAVENISMSEEYIEYEYSEIKIYKKGHKAIWKKI